MMDPDDDGPAVLGVMARQRACRRFDPTPLAEPLITRLLEAATRAPSAENTQPWVFVVVQEVARREAIWDLAERMWTGGGKEFTTASPALVADTDVGLTGGFAEAPVTVVVGADLERCRSDTASSSIYPAVQNLLVAATAHGLGSAFTTIATLLADELRAVVGLPDTVRPMVVVPLGRPARPLGKSRREPVAEHTHREEFGTGW